MTELQARIATNVFEIEGKLQVAGRFDFVTLISDKTRNFIPMFDATLTAILLPNLKVVSPGILFNRERIDMIAFLNQRAKQDEYVAALPDHLKRRVAAGKVILK